MNRKCLLKVLYEWLLIPLLFSAFLFPGIKKTEKTYAEKDENGDILIRAEDLHFLSGNRHLCPYRHAVFDWDPD